jgi:hypothetical protein
MWGYPVFRVPTESLGPTPREAVNLQVGPIFWHPARLSYLFTQQSGATVVTMRTGYPHVQASSQDNGSRLPAGGSSGAATCPRSSGSGSLLPAQDSSGAATCPRGSGSHLLTRGSSGPPCGTWAPASIIWLMAAPELPRVLRMGSPGRKQINKYPLATRPS